MRFCLRNYKIYKKFWGAGKYKALFRGKNFLILCLRFKIGPGHFTHTYLRQKPSPLVFLLWLTKYLNNLQIILCKWSPREIEFFFPISSRSTVLDLRDQFQIFWSTADLLTVVSDIIAKGSKRFRATRAVVLVYPRLLTVFGRWPSSQT